MYKKIKFENCTYTEILDTEFHDEITL